MGTQLRLVIDSSVWIDLEKGGLLSEAFGLADEWMAPDLIVHELIEPPAEDLLRPAFRAQRTAQRTRFLNDARQQAVVYEGLGIAHARRQAWARSSEAFTKAYRLYKRSVESSTAHKLTEPIERAFRGLVAVCAHGVANGRAKQSVRDVAREGARRGNQLLKARAEGDVDEALVVTTAALYVEAAYYVEALDILERYPLPSREHAARAARVRAVALDSRGRQFRTRAVSAYRAAVALEPQAASAPAIVARLAVLEAKR